MTEFESILKRYKEIDNLKECSDVLKETRELELKLDEFVEKKYPEIYHQVFVSYIHLLGIEDEESFIRRLINNCEINPLSLTDLDEEEIISNYIKSKNI